MLTFLANDYCRANAHNQKRTPQQPQGADKRQLSTDIRTGTAPPAHSQHAPASKRSEARMTGGEERPRLLLHRAQPTVLLLHRTQLTALEDPPRGCRPIPPFRNTHTHDSGTDPYPAPRAAATS